MKCTICSTDLPQASCDTAILICSDCRQLPNKLTLARKRMKVHMQEHRNEGHYSLLMTSHWVDPVPVIVREKEIAPTLATPVNPLKTLVYAR